MNTLIPGNLPQAKDSAIRFHLENALKEDSGILNLPVLRALCPVMFLAGRGYYRDSMGREGENDFGIFDDAGFLIAGDKIHRFNWNTDPSRVGYNAAIGKNFAMLAPGVWPFVKGQHKGRGPAWRQPDENNLPHELNTIFRDERRDGHFRVFRARDMAAIRSGVMPDEWGYQAINIHWGGEYGTSSWACQTAPPAQWPTFQKLSYKLTAGQPFLPYVLIDWPQ